MTSSTHIKGLLAGLAAVAIAGTVFAQGNPPNAAVKNAPIAAGQQSSQKTPMGETGVQTQSGTTAGTTAGTTGSTMSSGSTSSGTSMGASGASTDTTMAAAPRSTPRRARADRN